jgi:SAM-dependent methyltransferase
MRQSGYNDRLAMEWSCWVEDNSGEGTREREIFPILSEWAIDCAAKSFVDIGCGQGMVSTLIPEHLQFTGYDSSAALIARAQKIYGAPTRHFHIGDAHALPAGTGNFDAAISFWVWSHLADLNSAAKEMARVLRLGGHFFVVTANPETYEARKGFYRSYRIEGRLLTGDMELGEGRQLTDTTLYLHTTDEIHDALTQAGLSIRSTRTLGMHESYPGGLYVLLMGTKETEV